MASSIGCCPQFADEKAGDHEESCGKGKPGQGVLQVIVAQLRFGAWPAGKAVGIAAGKFLETNGATCRSGARPRTTAWRAHPTVPEIAVASLSDQRTPLMPWARTTALNSTGAGLSFRLAASFRPAETPRDPPGHNALIAPERRDNLPAGASLKRSSLCRSAA